MGIAVDRMIRDHMKAISKMRKAKVSDRCIYKKDGPYFWCITIREYSSLRYMVSVKIKPWSYDEFLNSITHPGENIRFTDSLRWQGFSAMSMYEISKDYYPHPPKDSCGEVDDAALHDWCKVIFDEATSILDRFCERIANEYGSLNEFHIKNAENDILLAAFASVSCGDYLVAEQLLVKAQQENCVFNRSYGSLSRDLRDVLLDYCNASQCGKKWTREMVIHGLRD